MYLFISLDWLILKNCHNKVQQSRCKYFRVFLFQVEASLLEIWRLVNHVGRKKFDANKDKLGSSIIPWWWEPLYGSHYEPITKLALFLSFLHAWDTLFHPSPIPLHHPVKGL